MLRTTLLSLILLISLSSSTSMLRKSISRRQTESQPCYAIEGFDCKCLLDRVTCTNDRDLPSTINIIENEKHKYQTVELVVTAASDINVNDQTFAPVKELYKPDGQSLEFRIKFEKFTALKLSSPGIFNQVFPNNLPAGARKALSLEIYNNDVPPNDNPQLFKNLNADSLELYALYPFHGTFQQLFDGANIKYVRLSGGDIRSDLSQPFTGNIGVLELAKQASSLSVQNFPVYPAHEIIINAFYISDFNNEHPPNYNNLGELRVFSTASIPANAFRNFPNIHTLSISSEQDINPQALNGLQKLEKLIIKDAKAPLELLKSVPNIKELEINIEKLDEKTQCQLLEKLASGQVAVQSIPNGRECTCVSAYLDTAGGRAPCNAPNCDQSSCATIKNNYDASTATFKAPPTILRADGSNALQPRQPKVYSTPFQVSYQDQEKLQKGAPPPPVQQPTQDDSQQPGGSDQYPYQQNPPYNPQDTSGHRNGDDIDRQNDDSPSVENNPNDNNNDNFQNDYDNIRPITTTTTFDSNSEIDPTTTPSSFFDGQQGGQDGNDGSETNVDGNNPQVEDNTNQQGGDNNNQQGGDGTQTEASNPDGIDGASGNGTETATPPKKGMSWLPIIIIAASIVALLLIGLIILFFRKKSNAAKGGKYDQAPTNEQGTQPK